MPFAGVKYKREIEKWLDFIGESQSSRIGTVKLEGLDTKRLNGLVWFGKCKRKKRTVLRIRIYSDMHHFPGSGSVPECSCIRDPDPEPTLISTT
jgi:hypothetical protein